MARIAQSSGVFAAAPRFEFHVARAARDRYHFDAALFSLTGNVVFADFAASREFARRMNLAREAARRPERAVPAAALHAMGLIDEAMHAVAAAYRRQRDPRALLDALAWFERRLGPERLAGALAAFVERFPALAVYRGAQSASDWLAAATAGTPHRAVALEELMLLWLANLNPAFAPFNELFDDRPLAVASAYTPLTAALREYFETRPRFGPDNLNLVDLLRAPALAAPDSLIGQLAYIREKWAPWLGDSLRRLLAVLDALREEELALWRRFHPPAAGGGDAWAGDSSAAAIPRFASARGEYERFSADFDWMPRTVLIAKSAHVWLEQLSQAHGRWIARLDQIPDGELDLLARRGFNALWLIGLWERSHASRRIKQLTGVADAVASAYSLQDYRLAEDLGGHAAYLNLRERAAARGIRLASDMVTNHMGIDSRWVMEHPDWFLSLPHSPFPAYRFEGPDLSSDGRVEIKIEDHYYDRSDAAVAFRRVDRWTGATRYIYHGNDGTSYPWNDTAQLDYLNPEVRESVVQTILHVARLFPIIRFDAAMTLAKRHYQRLWFPAPGDAGAIPSRAEHGMTEEAFGRAMPEEFWREVVDRVAAEAPGTLLLAEAFWLMEGYFVRTLGMHRVYNSAFMNMLRDEQNANYRSVIKNTLEFDPAVLQRYVNFMNNPDERTAIDQFGSGDKYFGVCTLMATLPGLPMFGHGQVEGYREKYGMDRRRASLDERPDPGLVARHEREIAPLLHRRELFAEAGEFLLYDFYTEAGWVNEDVFAYSNRRGNERALVVYHNRYAATRGWIRLSCAYAEKTAAGERRLRQRTLGEALGFASGPACLLAFRDAASGREHLARADDLAANGLRLDLGAYQRHVFVDWREIAGREAGNDDERPWQALAERLVGCGVPSLEAALRGIELEPAHRAFATLLESGAATTGDGGPSGPELARTWLEQGRRFTASAGGRAAGAPAAWKGDLAAVLASWCQQREAAMRLPEVAARVFADWKPPRATVGGVPWLGGSPKERTAVAAEVLAWCALEALGRFQDPEAPERAAVNLFDVLELRGAMAGAMGTLGLEGEERWRAAARLRAAFAHPLPVAEEGRDPITALIPTWCADPDLAWLLGIHEYEGARYFVQEAFEQLLTWIALPRLLSLAEPSGAGTAGLAELQRQLAALRAAAAARGYRA